MSLDPVREALLADARQHGDELRAAAGRDAAAAVRDARAEADRLLAAARAEGEAEARRERAIEGARLRRRARERVLTAQREAYERLRSEARRTVPQLRAEPGYEALLVGLATMARAQLGDAATVVVDDEVGGLVAHAGSRSVDYRLPAIAERCVAALGTELEALWQ